MFFIHSSLHICNLRPLTIRFQTRILLLIGLIILMLRERVSPDISEFFRYLASHAEADSGLPSLSELGRELGVSLASLREQLEVARALGMVEVRPRTGTRRLTYSFTPAIRQSLGYSVCMLPIFTFAKLR